MMTAAHLTCPLLRQIDDTFHSFLRSALRSESVRLCLPPMTFQRACFIFDATLYQVRVNSQATMMTSERPSKRPRLAENEAKGPTLPPIIGHFLAQNGVIAHKKLGRLAATTYGL